MKTDENGFIRDDICPSPYPLPQAKTTPGARDYSTGGLNVTVSKVHRSGKERVTTMNELA
jgi:hypothetical protein